MDATRRAFGRLDVLVNSASLFERQPVAAITESDWDRVLGVNLKGPFFLSQAAFSLLAETGGSIVNIADLSALQAWPNFAHHAVSKAGLVHLTRVLARALAPRVRVNAIVPGTVLPPSGYEGEDWVGGRDRRVIEAEGRPDDVVGALLYLVGAGFVTGQCLVVDGGRMLL
jgi:NAD(P)-dependent dehydrogenase (short-subunit alcohol dehydrogenase family)